MAFGSSSAVFGAFLLAPLCDSTGYTGYTNPMSSSTIKVALFNNSVTPDKNAAVASTRYTQGTWTVGNEVTDTNWPAGGIALASDAFSSITNGVKYDASDTPGSGTVTITNAFGCLVYNDSISAPQADQGVCFNSFGGAQSVTSGTFTIVWDANGIFTITG